MGGGRVGGGGGNLKLEVNPGGSTISMDPIIRTLALCVIFLIALLGTLVYILSVRF